MPARDQIIAGMADGPATLVDYNLGGHIVRVADRDLTLTDEAGLTYAYERGLSPVTWTDSAMGVDKLTLTLTTPQRDWALLEARGVRLDLREVVVRRWWPGQTLDSAEVLIRGLSEELQVGKLGEPLGLTAVRDPIRDSLPMLDPLAYVTADTWTAATIPDNVLGAPYVIPIGYPGHVDGADPQPAVPLVMVELNATPANSIMLVADRAVDATHIHAWNTSDGDNARIAVQAHGTQADLLGRNVSTALGGSTVVNNDSDAYWYGLGRASASATYGAGVTWPGRAGVLWGAGDVIEWALTKHTHALVDLGRIQGVVSQLNRYKVDCYINQAVDGWVFVRDVLLPHLPVVVRESNYGLWLQLINWAATPNDVRYHLTEGDQVQRVGRTNRLKQPIYNEVAIEFQPLRGGELYRSRRVLAADGAVTAAAGDVVLTNAAVVWPSSECRVSQSEYGRRPYTWQVPWTWDVATAGLIARDKVARYANPKRLIRVTGDATLEAIEPWSVVSYTDADLHITNGLALVQSRTITRAAITLDLILLNQPSLELRVTT